MTGGAPAYVEDGGSWRPFWAVAAVLGLLLGLDAVRPGADVPPVVSVVAPVAVLGVVAAGVLSARRVWTVRVEGAGADAALSVGRERVALTDVDAEHLRAARAGRAGVDAGASVLGGGWTLPRGRTGLPLRLSGGRTVLVPTRDPAALAAALLGAGRNTPRGGTGSSRTLGR